MSSPLRRRPRRLKTVAVAAALGGLALVPAAANADFTLPACGGSDVQGVGASFQVGAQTGWTNLFAGVDGCNGTPVIQAFQGNGSGAGRQALGERSGTNTTGQRSATYRYAAADEAPTTAQRQQIERGPVDGNGADVTAGDDGKLNVVPVAVGATAILVNYPDDCAIPAAAATTPPANTKTRLKLTNAQIEGVWGGDYATWGALLGAGMTGLNGKSDADCQATPITRVVRYGDSGTTYSLKSWLQTVKGDRAPGGWTGSQLGATPNTAWPVGGVATTVAAADVDCAGRTLCTGTTTSSGSVLAGAVRGKDGSFGYADLSTARAQGFALDAGSGGSDDTFWLPLTNGGAENDPNIAGGLAPAGTPGANCGAATFSNLPADTSGDFSKVTAAGSASGYPLCVLTYMLAFTDNAAVYGNTDAEQRKARTVKDYLTMVTGTAGQVVLPQRDYARLPTPIATMSRTAAAAITWNAAGSGTGANDTTGGQTTTTTTTTQTGTGGGGTTPAQTAPPVKTAPSNAFTVQSATVAKKTGKVTTTLRLPGAGAVSLAATAKVSGKTIKVGSATGNATAGGALKVTFSPSAKAKKALAKAKKLKVKLVFTFTPAGGAANSVTKSVTLKAVTKKKQKKAKKG